MESSSPEDGRPLEMSFITSRLRPRLSSTATHIGSCGKLALWTRQTAPGRNSLRKSAIMNRIRRRDVEYGHDLPWRTESAMPAFSHGLFADTNIFHPSFSQQTCTKTHSSHAILSTIPSADVAEGRPGSHDTSYSPGISQQIERYNDTISAPLGKAPRDRVPRPSSALDLTKYDYSVFDNEDGYFSIGDLEIEGDDLDQHRSERGLVYSDFGNINLEPSEMVLDDHDSPAVFSSLAFWN